MAPIRPIISIRDLEKIYTGKNSSVKALEQITLTFMKARFLVSSVKAVRAKAPLFAA